MPKACGTWCFPKHGTELRRHLGWCIRCHFKHLSPGLVGISSFCLSKIRCEPRVWFMFHVMKCGVLTPNMAEPFWDWWIVIFCWPIYRWWFHPLCPKNDPKGTTLVLNWWKWKKTQSLVYMPLAACNEILVGFSGVGLECVLCFYILFFICKPISGRFLLVKRVETTTQLAQPPEFPSSRVWLPHISMFPEVGASKLTLANPRCFSGF